jgi:hypothetical protein
MSAMLGKQPLNRGTFAEGCAGSTCRTHRASSLSYPKVRHVLALGRCLKWPALESQRASLLPALRGLSRLDAGERRLSEEQVALRRNKPCPDPIGRAHCRGRSPFPMC